MGNITFHNIFTTRPLVPPKEKGVDLPGHNSTNANTLPYDEKTRRHTDISPRQTNKRTNLHLKLSLLTIGTKLTYGRN